MSLLPRRIPVCIVGAGPVGSTLSLLLSSYNVKHIVIDKRETPLQHPQAHYISNRSMETFRYFNHLDKEILLQTPPLNQWYNFIYTTGFTGSPQDVIAIRHHMEDYAKHSNNTDYYDHYSPSKISHLAQHKLEPILRKKLLSSPGSPLHTAMELQSIESSSDSLTLHLKNNRTLQEEVIEAQHLVAADGAHSLVRRILHKHMTGVPTLQNLQSIFFRSKALAHYVKDKGAMISFVFNEKCIGVLVCHNAALGEFVLQVPLMGGETCDEARIEEMLASLSPRLYLGDLDIIEMRRWRMGALVSDAFIDSKHKNISFAGDSAHILPPSGGYGMNLGIGDALNLSWRLERIINGNVSEEWKNLLLSEYALERRGVALYYRKTAIHNFNCTVNIAKGMGLDYDIASKTSSLIESVFGKAGHSRPLDRTPSVSDTISNNDLGRPDNTHHMKADRGMRESVNNQGFSLSQMGSSLMQGIMSVGRSQIAIKKSIAPIWESLKAQVEAKMRNRNENLNLISPGLDMATAYQHRFSLFPPFHKMYQDMSSQEIQKLADHMDTYSQTMTEDNLPLRLPKSPYYYTPASWIGNRLPHLWIYSRTQGSDEFIKFSTTEIHKIGVLPSSPTVLAFNPKTLEEASKKLVGQKVNYVLWNFAKGRMEGEWHGDSSFIEEEKAFDCLEQRRVEKNVSEVQEIVSPDFILSQFLQWLEKPQEAIKGTVGLNSKCLFDASLVQTLAEDVVIVVRPDGFVRNLINVHKDSLGQEKLLDAVLCS